MQGDPPAAQRCGSGSQAGGRAGGCKRKIYLQFLQKFKRKVLGQKIKIPQIIFLKRIISCDKIVENRLDFLNLIRDILCWKGRMEYGECDAWEYRYLCQ